MCCRWGRFGFIRQLAQYNLRQSNTWFPISSRNLPIYTNKVLKNSVKTRHLQQWKYPKEFIGCFFHWNTFLTELCFFVGINRQPLWAGRAVHVLSHYPCNSEEWQSAVRYQYVNSVNVDTEIWNIIPPWQHTGSWKSKTNVKCSL